MMSALERGTRTPKADESADKLRDKGGGVTKADDFADVICTCPLLLTSKILYDEGYDLDTNLQGGAKRLLDLHVPPSDVMEEGFSLDTLGNAYFLRNTHINPGRFTRMIVVTNDWHMDRARAYFDAVFSLPQV